MKFCIVGAGGLLIDLAATYLLKSVLKLNKYLANSVGFVLGATFNYIFNRRWTFLSNDPHIAIQYVKFMVIATIGLLLSNSMIYLFHERLRGNFYVSKLGAMTIVTAWNYFMNVYVTFS
ncbi:MAG: GtrA family protein [Rikenellaceae bacterium]